MNGTLFKVYIKMNMYMSMNWSMFIQQFCYCEGITCQKCCIVLSYEMLHSMSVSSLTSGRFVPVQYLLSIL